MWPDDSSSSSLFAQFEREGEEMVRRRLAREVASAQDVIEHDLAAQWLKMKSHAREQEARNHVERQERTAQAANQLSERQVNLTEKAIQLSEKADRHAINANRLSKLAIGIGLASFLVAVVAVFK